MDERTSIAVSFRNNLRACTKCELHESCRSPVPWYGDLDPEIAIIGEAPGTQEDKHSQPFVGPAGQLMRGVLRRAGINPESVTWLNAVSCYPRDIRNPERQHINACRTWMRGQIAMIRPKFIITTGVVAFQSVRPSSWPKLVNLHGKPLHWDDPPVPAEPVCVWPTYHPSGALPGRAGGGKTKRTIEADIATFVAWRDNGCVWPEECYICLDELYRFDGWGIGLCERHAARQGSLFSEDALTANP